MKQPRLLLAAALAATGTPAALAQSPWLPAHGEVLATPGFTFQTFDEFWVGTTKVGPLKANDENQEQYVGFLNVDYGLFAGLAVDLTVGYGGTSSTDTFGGRSDEGFIDTSLGSRLRLVDEHGDVPAWAPTLTLRGGVIIPGDYDENTPFSLGDGAWGAEMQLLAGKAFGDSGFGLFGHVGYRTRQHPAPDDFLSLVGAYQQLHGFTLSAAYRHVASVEGLDIGGPGFNPADPRTGFPALKEINQQAEVTLAYSDRGGRQYAVLAAFTLDGRNTGDKLILGATITLPFGRH
jgi:hypothetical protein